MPAVITENDESAWHDETGSLYHFPKRYLDILQPGQSVIYYKGRLRDRAYEADRLSPEPHYFGVARIGRVYPDPESTKNDHFATIDDYRPFAAALAVRDERGHLFEEIPPNRATNHWRDGVRAISQTVYDSILGAAIITDTPAMSARDDWPTRELQSGLEGSERKIFTTVYERDPRLRKEALAIHGYSCRACGFDFESTYGEHGRGFIHVHHVKPLHAASGSHAVNPESDLIPVCANCHYMIQRKKGHTLSLEELQQAMERSKRLAVPNPASD